VRPHRTNHLFILDADPFISIGQAESGKSTVLKNFQLHFSPKTFEAEAIFWRPVIHLNLVRCTNFILNFLKDSHGSPTQYSPQLDGFRRYFIRLAPLRQVEESLTRKLSASLSPAPDGRTVHYHPAKASEIALRPGSGWKGLFKGKRQAGTNSDDSDRRILAACADDILNLWNDPSAQESLTTKNIILGDQPGFFLEDVKRITQEDYRPTPGDILRARVATIGPEEHHIRVEGGRKSPLFFSSQWLVIVFI